jgi:hypothetical protein
VDKRETDQFYIVSAMAVIVLAISVWAFVMSLHTGAAGGVVDHSASESSKTADTSKAQETTLDTEAMAQAAIEEISFDTELTKMEDSVVESMISTASDDTKVELYMGEGTCADELLFVTVAKEGDLDGEIEAVQKHLTEMQQSFEDYLPKEAKKIDNAVILQSGLYIVACVSGDKDSTRKVLEEQLKGSTAQ